MREIAALKALHRAGGDFVCGIVDVIAVEDPPQLLMVLEKMQGDAARVQKKLANESFVAKAPANIVDKERQKLADLNDAIRRIENQLDKFRE